MLEMKKFLFFFICTFASLICDGQTVLLEEKVSANDFKKPTEGPNFRHFGHLFIGLGFYIPQGKDLEIETKPGSTTSFEFGWRYKLKLTNWFAMGTGINYVNDIFNLKQVETKVVPLDTLHSKERIRFNNIGSEFYVRLNFGKRGNIIGKFIDLGVYANWAFAINHMYQDKYDSQLPYQAGSQRVILYHLKYVERFNYGLKARIGVNRYILTASYRLSELLDSEYREQVGNYFFPKLSIGLEIGLHN
jgi:hypothetical protein